MRRRASISSNCSSRADGLTPLLPRKNVQQDLAERDHGDHQKCSGQNNVSHDNTSFVVVARAQIDAGNLGFSRQSVVRLRQNTRAWGYDASWANVPPRCNRREPICFSPHLYRARNLVERFFNKIKQCRRVATRYDKLAANYLAFIQLASIRLWLRAL